MTNPKFTIIIPAHNAERTIRQCLDAVARSDFGDFETIVVDDASTDMTVQMAKRYPCRIIHLDERRGPAYARMAGIKETSSDTVIFIDSDVMIAENTLSAVEDTFCRNKDVDAVVGILSKDNPNNGFFSRYKNLYMHYIFNLCPESIDFIYGSFYAIKKECASLATQDTLYGEDTELGMRLAEEGRRIFLNKNIQVTHLKNYSLWPILKNDFVIPFHWARLFMRHKGWNNVLGKGRFCHSPKEQLISIMLAPAIPPLFFFIPASGAALLMIQTLLNMRFFIFLYKERGITFTLRAILFTWLDLFVMSLGILMGFSRQLFKEMIRQAKI